MNEYASAHRKVIATLHTTWFDGEPFALRDVVKYSDTSKSSCLRILKFLVQINLVKNSRKAFGGRHYRLTKNWPMRLENAIQTFEYGHILYVAEPRKKG